MKYSKYFLIIAFFGIVTSCSDFLDRTNPNEPDNVTFWVNEDQLKNALPPCPIGSEGEAVSIRVLASGNLT